MKITCTLSEYTKLARQCGETKARFNCRNCPLNGVVEPPDGESCDIERFVQAIILGKDKDNTWENVKRKVLEETEMHNPLAGTVPEGCLHVTVPRLRDGVGYETR